MFRVVYELDVSKHWHAHVPAVSGCRSEGRSLAEARRHIREALATCVDVFDDPDVVSRTAELVDDVRLPARAVRLIGRARQARRIAETHEARARSATAAAARALARDLKLSLRDAGELLGVSHQRVKQLTETRARAAK